MLNPLSLPNEVLSALRSVGAIERLLDARIARLPDELESTLRRHFEGQRGDLAQLHDELVANREKAEQLPGKVDGLREGPAERVARLSERLPGGG